MVNYVSCLSHCGTQRRWVFENWVLGRICGPKRDEVTGECRKLHEVFTDQYRSPKMFRVIKSRIMGCAGHVTRTGDRVGACRVLVGDLREWGSLQDLLVDGTRIFKWVLMEQYRRAWTGLIWFWIGTTIRLLWHSNELSCYKQRGDFLSGWGTISLSNGLCSAPPVANVSRTINTHICFEDAKSVSFLRCYWLSRIIYYTEENPVLRKDIICADWRKILMGRSLTQSLCARA
jgi:hypothetical protein